MGVDLLVERLLDVQALDHRLDDPVAVFEHIEVVVDIAGGDQAGVALGHERRRIGLQQLRHRAFGNSVPVGAVLRHDVEQHAGDARVGDVRGDAGPHHACADDGGFLDLGHVQSLQHSGVMARFIRAIHSSPCTTLASR